MPRLPFSRINDWLQALIRRSSGGQQLLWLCSLLSLSGTMSAAYPVTAVVTPAALLAPTRWRQIALVSATGSTLGATLLVLLFHHLGWPQLYRYYPDLAGNQAWRQVMDWAAQDGPLALFLIAVSPLPQTPALIFFGLGEHHYLGVFFAMLAGKALKYGAFAWLAAHCPERLRNGISGLFR